MKRASPVIVAIILFMCSITVHAYDDGIPDDIRTYCEEAEEESGVLAELLEAIGYFESGYNQYAVNRAGTCYGIMQVYKKFHIARMEKLGVTDICDKQGNIRVAADLLAELFEEYEDTGVVMMVYGGYKDAAIEKYKETGNLPSYCKKVLDKSAEFERIHGR